jgi:DMSO/TMAO reductase YedYZ molybdopterin-dependent catalytic subunit
MTRKTILENPYNAETPLDRLDGGIVPAADFFVRSHFAVPEIDRRSWRCTVGGSVVDFEALSALPRRRVVVTLECAGNGRTLLRPEVQGAPWRLGAAGTAEFEGVALSEVLDRAGIDGAREILFRGADEGQVADGRTLAFERSLPIEVARDPDVLLAWGMNGAPLAREHGAPVRLLVPGWYGVASVKWLVEVRPLPTPYRGYFQGESYVYRGSTAFPDGTPVTAIRVRSIISSPEDGARVAAGEIEVRGSAWSGSGPIARVEVSANAGETWTEAALKPTAAPHAATGWTAAVRVAGPGDVEIRARATDQAGNTQPDAPNWNALGYGNNAVQRLTVRVG